MKFELKYIDEENVDYMVYITRNAFIKAFEKDKDKACKELGYLTEMVASPHCFEVHLTKEEVTKAYQELIENKKYKGLIFYIEEDFDENMSFEMSFRI